MKKLTYLITIILGLIALTPTRAQADAEIGSVTGAGQGLFESGAALGAVNLDGVEMAIGVFIEANGAATGVFHAVLAGHSFLGDAEITVEGEVTAGDFGTLGDTSFSGVATVDLGDGTPPLPGVPFTVTIMGGSVVLAIESTTLLPAGMPEDSITIE